jgi:hypothetical protein
MASRPRCVDLGPLYLQVGEEARGADGAPTRDTADAADTARFDALMQKGRHHQQRETDAAADLLLEPLREPQAQLLPESDDIGRELAHLWVGTGLRSAREVRVGLRDALLPDTWVRLHESEGRLRIEFACASAHVAHWLVRRLPAVASNLGERLQRPLELHVSMNGAGVGEHRWPGDPR